MRMFLTWLVPMGLFMAWFAWHEGFITMPQDRQSAGVVRPETIYPPAEGGVLALSPGIYGNTIKGPAKGIILDLGGQTSIQINGNTIKGTLER